MRRAASLHVLVLGLVVVGAVRSPGASADAADSNVVVAGDVGARLDRYLVTATTFGFSGAALVARDGKVVLCKGYGLADRAANVPNRPTTLFEIASATKPFTACAVVRLAELGGLSLDDPIGKHLPGVPEDKRRITVRHLLAHTSGMSRSVGGSGADVETAVRSYLARPAARAPGKAFEYWNGGYALLAGIVERASGRSYVEFCRDELFRRAGLEHTGFPGDTEMTPQATGYDDDVAVRPATGHAYRDYGFQYRGMGGVVTSVLDLWRFVRAFEDGKVVSKDSRRDMEIPVTPNYGLGWGMATTKRKTRRVGHGGDVRGFHAQIQRFPDENAVVIVLSNVEGIPLWTVAWNLEALLFGETPPNPMPPEPAAVAAKVRDALPGTYRWKEGEEVRVEASGSGLRLTAQGPEVAGLLTGRRVAGLAEDLENATEIVEAVRRGDEKLVASRLLPTIPASWPDTLTTRIWPAHLERHGALVSFRALGAETLAPGRTEIVFALVHEKGEARLRVVLQGGKLNIFDLEGPRASFSRVYVPVSEAEYASFAWEGSPPPHVRFERGARGKGRDLVIPSSGGAVRLHRIP